MYYSPQSAPDIAEKLPGYVEEELRRISDSLQSMHASQVQMRLLYAVPSKPRTGTVILAAADVVSGGALEGLYRYSSGGAWVYIG